MIAIAKLEIGVDRSGFLNLVGRASLTVRGPNTGNRYGINIPLHSAALAVGNRDSRAQLYLCIWTRLQNIEDVGVIDRRLIVNLKRFRRAAAVEGSLNTDRKSTRLNSSHVAISYAVFC